MLHVIIQKVVILSVIRPSVVRLNVVMLNVVMLKCHHTEGRNTDCHSAVSVIMLNVTFIVC